MICSTGVMNDFVSDLCEILSWEPKIFVRNNIGDCRTQQSPIVLCGEPREEDRGSLRGYPKVS